MSIPSSSAAGGFSSTTNPTYLTTTTTTTTTTATTTTTTATTTATTSSTSALSTSGSSSHYSAKKIKARLGKEASHRSAFMCSPDANFATHSSIYFYSIVKVVNRFSSSDSLKDKDFMKIDSVRPKKIEKIRSSYQADSKYQKIKIKKQEALKELTKKLRDNKANNFKNLIKGYARFNKPFSDLHLSDLPGVSEKDLTSLKEAYDVYQNKCAQIQNLRNLTNLSELFNPNDLNEREQNSIKHLYKCDDLSEAQEWNDRSSVIFSAIAKVWTTEGAKLFDKYQHAPAFDRPTGPFINNLIFPINDQTLTRNKVFSKCLCRFIWNRIYDKLEKINAEFVDNFDKALVGQEKIIEAYAHAHIENDIQGIRFLLKQQKQHSFARFGLLAEHYEDFARHAKLLGEMADAIEPGLSIILFDLLSEILKHSHYSDLEEKIKELESKSDAKSIKKLGELKKQQELLTVSDLYRKHDIMGFEAKDYFKPGEKEDAVIALNSMMQLFNTEEEIEKMERSHTFPFPAMFSWDSEKMKSILASKGLEIKEDFHPEPRYITSDFVHFMRESEEASSVVLDQTFERELEKIKSEVKNDKAKFIYCALDLLKHYHLRVFSETELFPDFINQYSDQLSEWKLSGETKGPKTYKESLALGMVKLLRENTITKKIVHACLSEYHKGTRDKIKEDKKNAQPDKDSTIFSLIKKITRLQVKQSLILAETTMNIKIKEADRIKTI